MGENYLFNFFSQVPRNRSHRLLYFVQLGGFVAKREAKAHRLQVDTLSVVGASDGEGLGNPRTKSFSLELVHLRHNIYGSRGRKRAGSLRPRHL